MAAQRPYSWSRLRSLARKAAQEHRRGETRPLDQLLGWDRWPRGARPSRRQFQEGRPARQYLLSANWTRRRSPAHSAKTGTGSSVPVRDLCLRFWFQRRMDSSSYTKAVSAAA